MQKYLVGGAIRDRLLDYPYTEKDWVVVGSSPEQMIALGFRPVGNDFPVFLHPESGEEHALARTEKKSGKGYRGFTFYTARDVSLEEDLKRRDLTINAMAESGEGQLIDPYNGQQDLQQRKLRHVSDAFMEDPLRVLRTARFAARYHHLGFTIATETIEAMCRISACGELEHLVAERVWQETERALGEKSPHIFFNVLRQCGALAILFPELDAVFGVPQRSERQFEIDTGVHTLLALEQAARLSDSTEVRFAVAFHDVGRGVADTIRSCQKTVYTQRSVALVEDLCKRLKVPGQFRRLGVVVAQFHCQCHRAVELKPEALLRLILHVGAGNAKDLLEPFLLSCEADARGHPGLEDLPYAVAGYLRDAQREVSSISVDDLVVDGIKGAEIGKHLRLRQTKRLEHFQQRQG